MCFVAVFERLRTILHEAQIDKRVQYMIEVMFAVRKDGFKVNKQFTFLWPVAFGEHYVAVLL